MHVVFICLYHFQLYELPTFSETHDPSLCLASCRCHMNVLSIVNSYMKTNINQPDAATSQVYYLSFKYSSTCFGRPHAHHQELCNCISSLWFYRWSLVIAVLLVVVGPARPRPTALLSPCSSGKTRGCYRSC